MECVTSQKIRIYPKNEDRWIHALNVYRRAYNLSISLFKGFYSPRIGAIYGENPSSKLRKQVVDWCKYEFEQVDVNLVQDAYRTACKTRSAVIKKRKSDGFARYTFLSKNDTGQYFAIGRLGKTIGYNVYPKLVGGFSLTEPLPSSAVGKSAIVTYRSGQWFISVKTFTKIEPEVKSNLRLIALDCGVRTFQSGYSEGDSVEYGKGFVSDRLTPLMLRMDKLLSIKAKLTKVSDSQFKQDKTKELNKKINTLRARQKNLVDDLHKRVAFDLVTNYDIILLPTFETKQMSKKSNETKKRFLHRKTVRSMLSLSHYKFKEILKWMAKKYGKKVIDVNESYTSKTLWDGSIMTNLGGKKSITFKGVKVDRDTHGARNIMIRFLTNVLEFLGLKGTHPIINTNIADMRTRNSAVLAV